jgi:hypothetical protein
MPDVSTRSRHVTCDVSSAAARWARVKKALGARTNAEAAAQIGSPLRSLDRLFEHPDTSLMRHALRVRSETGIGLDDLFPAEPARNKRLAKAAA